MNPLRTTFLSAVRSVTDHVETTQMNAVGTAAELVADSLAAGGVLRAFGTGHSEAVAMELAGRAGGFISSEKLALRDVVIYGGEPVDVLMDLKAERDPLLAHRVYALSPVAAEDIFVIASNSGGNGSVVEMAALVKAKGHRLIAITSMAHTSRITSRHPSGKRLFELADVVLDNGAPYGDAVLELPGGASACGVSSIGSALLAQLVVAETIERLIARGIEPPIYLSANIAEGDKHNDALEAKYVGRIRRTAA
ncbi:putative phosphosugar-binding protein [Catenulispora sp. GAS73]|uniref:sugar isomerase domain-containing protein n=1 Tax=Catenulispora sp. GAS73 TaxID=3156269 RepID=UPI0035156730